MNRTIRALKSDDVEQIIEYFLTADHDFLAGMGVNPQKLPDADSWKSLLNQDLNRSLPDKQFYYLIWEFNNRPVGHSNINKIVFGQEAYMHLHLWQPQNRQTGHGIYFVSQSISKYFQTFNLQYLLCEPYALNPAPNKTLAKAGFELIQTYETTPGWINFQQTVNRWVLTRERWLQTNIN